VEENFRKLCTDSILISFMLKFSEFAQSRNHLPLGGLAHDDTTVSTVFFIFKLNDLYIKYLRDCLLVNDP
jgi:hypothetical protein